MSAANTVAVKTWANARKERTATAAAITPGQLLELNASGQVLRHSTAGGIHNHLIAIENDLQGADIDDDYAVSVQIQYMVGQRGEEFNMLLKDGETAVIGSRLYSDGAGDLQVENTTTEQGQGLVGYALEALDLSSSTGAEPTRRILVELC